MKKQYDFFISYSKNIYEKFISCLVKELEKYGIDVWLDQKDVHLGDQIILNLYNTLDTFKSSVYGIILVLDTSFFKKSWCLKELNYILKNNISFFPILYYIEKQDIPKPYEILRNYNMVTLCNEKIDIKTAVNKILDAYLQKEILRKLVIKNNIFTILIRNYYEASKANEYIIILADNIAMYIKIWHKNNNYMIDKYTNVLINIIHYKLLDYYNAIQISNYEIKLVCEATENLIKIYTDFDLYSSD